MKKFTLQTKNTLSASIVLPAITMTASLLTLPACTPQTPQVLLTIADARTHPAQVVDLGEKGDSVGDILLFDQPLLDKNMNEIGNNSGSCIRTRVGHSFQCQWTLVFDKKNNNGSIQVAGREYDNGTSSISIVAGTGKYSGISGEMKSTNNNDGTFTQELHYRIKH
jgi:hypothetical protein